MNALIFTVHTLNNYVKGLLSRDPLLHHVKVRGEISNFKLHSSGHMYFTLKDEQDRIRCVFFKQSSGGLSFVPRDGFQVVVKGSVSLYGRDGQYQLYIESMEKDGVGDLYKAFEALKDKLKAEGLFDRDIKKPLPQYPRKIALITSHTSAAVKDMINVMQRRNGNIEILVIPVMVQGPEAHRQISTALDYANTRGDIDIIIIGRGGGSIEELWAFNEEDVARAIWRSRIPVISAVGHETDFTISDFVADVRAPTPSAAGELSAPEMIQLKTTILRLEKDLIGYMTAFINARLQKFNNLKNHYVFRAPKLLLNQHSQYVDQLYQRLTTSLRGTLKSKQDGLSKTVAALNALSPLHVLERGFIYALTEDTKLPVYSVNQLKPDNDIQLILKDGQAQCRVKTINGNDSAGPKLAKVIPHIKETNE